MIQSSLTRTLSAALFALGIIGIFGSAGCGGGGGTNNAPNPSPSPTQSVPANPTPTPGITPTPLSTPNVAAIEAQILTMVNNYRASKSIAPLQLDATLAAQARSWSETMAQSGNYVHSGTPDTGENIHLILSWVPTSEIAATVMYGRPNGASVYGPGLTDQQYASAWYIGWIGSPEHRENLLITGYQTIGIGAGIAPNGDIYLTQQFK